MDLFDYCNYESETFPNSAPPQILGSSKPHELQFIAFPPTISFLTPDLLIASLWTSQSLPSTETIDTISI